MGATPLSQVDLRSDTAAADLSAAVADSGFVELVGHGVDQDAARDLRHVADAFFALPSEAKADFVHPEPTANRGFRAKRSEALSYSIGEPSPPDLFESFNCGSDLRVDGSALLQQTPWPDSAVPGFRSAAHAYIAQMERLAAALDGLFGESLGFGPGELPAMSQAGPDTLAVIDYRPDPDGEEPVEPGQQRMGAHSDYTSFTILDADPVPGLQIVDASGEWVDVTPTAGALLVNIGDVLAMFSNDEWPSTLHRVVPMAAGSAPTRRSVAYFHYPDCDVAVAPLSGFVSDDRPARYGPVRVADHLLGKLAAPKTLERATGASTVAGRPTR